MKRQYRRQRVNAEEQIYGHPIVDPRQMDLVDMAHIASLYSLIQKSNNELSKIREQRNIVFSEMVERVEVFRDNECDCVLAGLAHYLNFEKLFDAWVLL